MRFIHISDLHLGMTPDEQFRWGELRKEELFKNLERIVDVCNNENIDLLLIAGDLFDCLPDSVILSRVNTFFTDLIVTKVVIIGGEKDKTFLKTVVQYDWSINVKFFSDEIISSIYFEDINTEIYGGSLSDRSEKVIEYDSITINDISRNNILLAYGGDENSVIIDFEKIVSMGFNYVALGQRHMHQQIDSNMVYSGSLEALDKSEAGKHGYIIGEIGEHGTRYDFIPFSIRNYYNEIVNIDMNSTDESLICYIETVINQYGTENIFSITIEGFRNPCIKFYFDELFRNYNITGIIDNSLPHFDYEVLYKLNKDNLIGKYIFKVKNMQLDEDTKNKALYLGVEALIKKTEYY